MYTLLILSFLIFLFVFQIWNFIRKRKRNVGDKEHNDFKKAEFKSEFTEEQLTLQAKNLNQNEIEFKAQFEEIKQSFPFDNWYNVSNKEYGMEQYTKENCQKAESIMTTLINELFKLGLKAKESKKIELFRVATEAYNTLNEETNWEIIETGEREELCEIIDKIGLNCGIIPEKYGNGDGIASVWRDW